MIRNLPTKMPWFTNHPLPELDDFFVCKYFFATWILIFAFIFIVYLTQSVIHIQIFKHFYFNFLWRKSRSQEDNFYILKSCFTFFHNLEWKTNSNFTGKVNVMLKLTRLCNFTFKCGEILLNLFKGKAKHEYHIHLRV